MELKEIDFDEFLQEVKDDNTLEDTVAPDKEGIVLLGCGDIQDHIEGVSEALQKRNITKTDDPERLWEKKYLLTTTGGRKDIALIFGKEKFNLGKMAIWRLQMAGRVSWISNYIVNYADQY